MNETLFARVHPSPKPVVNPSVYERIKGLRILGFSLEGFVRDTEHDYSVCLVHSSYLKQPNFSEQSYVYLVVEDGEPKSVLSSYEMKRRLGGEFEITRSSDLSSQKMRLYSVNYPLCGVKRTSDN